MQLTYPALIHRGSNTFGLYFLDMACVTVGKTFPELIRSANVALLLHIEGLLKQGNKLPEPMEFDKALNEARKWNGALMYITIEIIGEHEFIGS